MGEGSPLACLRVYMSGGGDMSGVWCLEFKRRCPRPILSGASWSDGAGCRIPRTLFTAGRCGRPLPELGRPAVKSGEPIGDCLPSGIMCVRQEAVQSLLAARGHERVDGELACAAVFRGVVHAFKLDK